MKVTIDIKLRSHSIFYCVAVGLGSVERYLVWAKVLIIQVCKMLLLLKILIILLIWIICTHCNTRYFKLNWGDIIAYEDYKI